MSMLNIQLSGGIIPKYDNNLIKWSGYFATSKQAEEHLREQTQEFACTENKLVVSSKSEFVNRHFKGYFLYRFTIVLCNRNEK